jgi:hypothetical protein
MQLNNTQSVNAFAGMGALSSLISGGAQFMGGRQQQGAYNNNANITREQMAEKSEVSQNKYTALIGKERSLYAKAGVDISSGSPLLIAMDTASKGEEEAGRIKTAGESEASMEEFYGKQAAFAGTMGGVGTFLSGLSKAGMMSQMSNKGGYDPYAMGTGW